MSHEADPKGGQPGLTLGALQPDARSGAGRRARREAARKAARQRDINELIVEFQSDSVEIEHGPPPRVALITTYMLLALFAVAVTWGSLAEVDRIVSATGTLVTTDPQIVVQPYEVGVIRSIDAQVGQVVRKGQVLATLDSTFVKADVSDLQTRKSSLVAEVARLRAEVDGKPYAPGPNASADELLQATIHQRRIASFRSQVEVAEQDIAQTEANIRTLIADIQVNEQRMGVVTEVEKMRNDLERTAVGSKLNVLIARSDRLTVTRDLDRARNSLAEQRHRLSGLQARREAIVQNWRQEAASFLVEASRRLDSVEEQLQKAVRRSELVTLTAPEDAVVLSVVDRSVGSIQQEAEPLMTLVPLNSKLEAEVKVDPRDVGLIATGMPVQVKLDAFPYQKHGMIHGDLRTISENTIKPQNQQDNRSFYRARVGLDEIKLRAMPENYRLLPGMTVGAEIKLGTRSVLSYFLYPLVRTFDESLTEP
ncbi:HlyD family type I secretion periplasmic adaptor subunit [Arenibaculum pallidiluteum]|uniref:HlyD family type I secretion periplasmic adaptor subunit n=1 Tax=Arenibaculum pallidiluteum TaxID=2812559 RepID=UPI001A978E38|nr:HlyD family type I secretion periplasmic adaptor subunit [Arenibaculum pallidiluteum]